MTLKKLSLTFGVVAAAACAPATSSSRPSVPSVPAPTVDPRVGLRAGANDAAEATWNLKVVAKAPPTGQFVGSTNSDLAFTGNYAIQGNYNGFQVWDITNPSNPVLKTSYYCPASQSDVSVYKNLLFVSGEGFGGRLDCGGQGVKDTVSAERLRGLRIFDISDITRPKYVCTRYSSIPRTRRTSTSTSPAPPRCARRARCRDACVRRPTRIRSPRSSASR